MSETASPRLLPKPEVLRRNVDSKLDSLTVEQLATIHEMLVRMEMSGLVKGIDEDFAVAEDAGKLTPEAIQASILEHRRRQPYGR